MLKNFLLRKQRRNILTRDADADRRERRGFMRGLGVAAAGAAAAAALGTNGQGVSKAEAADIDVAILQFALNLEYLEAEFYLRAAFGYGLSSADTGPNPGTVTGGSMVPFKSAYIQAYAQEIAMEEQKHVQFLRAALSAVGATIPEPNIDLVSSFKKIGSLTGVNSNFDPFKNEKEFLLGAYLFEDVGVTAYHFATPLITNLNYLDKAAGILAVEAYHAGIIRTTLFNEGYAIQTQALSTLRATLDGTLGTPEVDDYGVGTTSAPSIVLCTTAANGSLLGAFPSNSPPGNNAIAFDRNTRMVLNIVYGGVNATQGLFFPNGMNGTIVS